MDFKRLLQSLVTRDVFYCWVKNEQVDCRLAYSGGVSIVWPALFKEQQAGVVTKSSYTGAIHPPEAQLTPVVCSLILSLDFRSPPPPTQTQTHTNSRTHLFDYVQGMMLISMWIHSLMEHFTVNLMHYLLTQTHAFDTLSWNDKGIHFAHLSMLKRSLGSLAIRLKLLRWNIHAIKMEFKDIRLPATYFNVSNMKTFFR